MAGKRGGAFLPSRGATRLLLLAAILVVALLAGSCGGSGGEAQGNGELEALTATLLDTQSDDADRIDAAEALGATGDPKAVTPLIEVLGEKRSSSTWSVPDQAHQALLAIGGPAVEPLRVALRESDSKRMRARAAVTLAGSTTAP